MSRSDKKINKLSKINKLTKIVDICFGQSD